MAQTIIDNIGKYDTLSLLENVKGLNKIEFETLLNYLSEKYYNTESEIVTDETFDLLTETFEKRFEKRENVGVKPVELKKVKLNYYMGSLDKVTDEKDFSNWMKKRQSDTFIVSVKLDGVSALYEKNSLTKRGNGSEGTDISHLLPFLKLWETNIPLRGEMVVKKKTFEKYTEMKKARNMVAGITNKKSIDKSIIKDIDVVFFKIFNSNIKPSEQLKKIQKMGLQTVQHWIMKNPTFNELSELLKKEKEECEYEIDGLVLTEDIITDDLIGKNPEHMIAFKMSGEILITKVIKVEWNPSRRGILKPRVNIEPVNTGGSVINWASGHNADFIKTKGIGPGAEVYITRSGDVIPKIIDTLKKVEPQYPDTEHRWEGKEIVALGNNDINPEVQIQKLVHFFRELDIQFLAEQTILKIYNGGYKSLSDFLDLTVEKLLKIPTFKELSSKRIVQNIQAGIKEIEPEKLMAASDCFGIGFGAKKCLKVLEMYPDIIEWKINDKKECIDKIKKVEGIDTLAERFVDGLKSFQKFIKNHSQITLKKIEPEIIFLDEDESDIRGIEFVFTKYRNTFLEGKIKNKGGIIKDSVTKKTNYVIVKEKTDENLSSVKAKKAVQYNIEILDEEELIDKFGLN